MIGRWEGLMLLLWALCGSICSGWAAADLTADPGFVDDFELGYLGPVWTCQSSRPVNPRASLNLTSEFGAVSGARSLILGYSGVDYIRMEVMLAVDLSGYDRATFSFQAKDYGDEPHDLPDWEPFTGSVNADYLAASPDGVTWYPLLPLTAASGTLTDSWELISVPLHEALAPWGLPVASIRYIRFSQYDNGRPNLPGDPDGIGLDDVTLSAPASWGDAPEPFAVSREEHGAVHLQSAGPFLGTPPVLQENGGHNPLAAATPSDDGIRLLEPMIPGSAILVEITVSGSGWLQGWIDFNGDGDWTDPDEQVYENVWLQEGAHALPVMIPASARPGHHAAARFRISSLDGLDYGGMAPDGEVEDYLWPILPAAPQITAPSGPVLTSPATITWTPSDAERYTAQCSARSDFVEPLFGTVHTPDLSTSFAFTDDQTLWFRVKGTVAARRRTDLLSLEPPFAQATLAGTRHAPGLGICLAGPAIRLETIGGPSENERTTVINGGRANIFRTGTADTRVLEWEGFVGCFAEVTVELAVFRGGNTVNDPWTKIWSRQLTLEPGIHWVHSGQMDLTLLANSLYAFSVTSPDTIDIFSDAAVTNNPAWGMLTHRASLEGFPGTFSIFSPTARPYYMRFRSADIGAFADSGAALIPIDFPAGAHGWDTLALTAEIPQQAGMVCDILSAGSLEPLPEYENLSFPADLNGLAVDNFVLRVRMTSADPTISPVLRAVQLSYYLDPENALSGPWSEVRSAYADLHPPRLIELDRLDPSPTQASAVRYRAFFSEPVSGPGLYSPYPGWMPLGLSPVSIAGIAPAPEPNAWDITLSIPEDVGGMLGLRCEVGDHITDQVGRPLAEACTSSEEYDMDRIRPWVTGFWRMDPSPTNAPVIRWRVFFSEPVLNIPQHEGSDGWRITGSAGGSLLEVEVQDNYCDVLVRSGASDGTLGITLAAGSTLTDRVGWTMALNATANVGYQISHLRLISSPPPQMVVTAGSRLTLLVEAAGGTQPRQYLWSWSPDGVAWRNVAGADQPWLMLDIVGPADDGWYLCQVTDPWETVSSPPVRVQVEGALPAGGLNAAGLAALALVILTLARIRRFMPAGHRIACR